MLDLLKLSQSLLTLSSNFFGFFFLLVVLIGCFLLPYVLNHWFDSQLHPLCCCFLVNCSLFQLVYPCVWLDLFYAVEVLLSSLSILITNVLNAASEKLLISISFSSFSGVWSDLSFGHVAFWQLPCVCFYVLGRAALTPCLGSVAYYSRCLVGTASPITQAGYSRYALYVGWVHLPLVVEPWWLLVDQFTQASQIQGLAVTNYHQPLPSVEYSQCRGRVVVLWCGL